MSLAERLDVATLFLCVAAGAWLVMLTAQRVADIWRARKGKVRPLTAAELRERTDALAECCNDLVRRVEKLERRVERATNTTRAREDSP